MVGFRFMRSKALAGARVALGVGCLSGAAAMCASSPGAQAIAPGAESAGPTLFGERIGSEPAPVAARAIAERYLEGAIALVVDGSVVSIPRRTLGADVDVDALAALLEDARDARGRMHALRDALGIESPIELRLPVRLRLDAAMRRLLDAKPGVDRAPRDARFDLSARRIVPERVGRVLDVYATLHRIEDALRSNEARVEAVIHRASPRRTAADLAQLEVGAVVSEYETRYNMTEDVADRTHNLHVAAERIDGTVLLPGEVFDYNAVVGPRTHVNGFRNATVIAGGELSEDVGGGACQISGTLHAAALFAGLEILERSPHSRPSSYIKLGLDAMVNYPSVNFRFRNDLPFPVLLHVTVGHGTVRAEVLGKQRTRVVTFVREIEGYTPYVEEVREDPTLPTGVRVLDQRGVAGFEVSRLRVVRDPITNQAVRTKSEDVYPPTTQIWRVGTGGPAPEGYEPPPHDDHGEYRADGFMTMMQGVGITGTVERREPRATGEVGWTEKAGMPRADVGAEED